MSMSYVVATTVTPRSLANIGISIPFVYRVEAGLDIEVSIFSSNNREVLEEFLAETTSICLISEVSTLTQLSNMKDILEDYSMYIRKKHVKEGATSFAANTIFQFSEDTSDPKTWIRPNLEIKAEVEQFDAVWKDCLAKLTQGACYFAFPLPISTKADFSSGGDLKSIREYTGIDVKYIRVLSTTAKSYSELMGSWCQPFKCYNSEFVTFKEVGEDIILNSSPCLAKCPRFINYYNDKCELGSFNCLLSRLIVEEPSLFEGLY